MHLPYLCTYHTFKMLILYSNHHYHKQLNYILIYLLPFPIKAKYVSLAALPVYCRQDKNGGNFDALPTA